MGAGRWGPPTLEKIRVGHAHPGNANRGPKTFRQQFVNKTSGEQLICTVLQCSLLITLQIKYTVFLKNVPPLQLAIIFTCTVTV